MIGISRRLAELPEDIQLRTRVEILQHLAINMILALQEPVTLFVGNKAVMVDESGPMLNISRSDDVDTYLPSPQEVQGMLQHISSWTDPFVHDPANKEAKDVAREMIKILLQTPAHFV